MSWTRRRKRRLGRWRRRREKSINVNIVAKAMCFKHKRAHHKTWLCKEVTPILVKVEPRRKLSSNIYHLPTIDASEEEVDERGEEPGEKNCKGGGGLFEVRSEEKNELKS